MEKKIKIIIMSIIIVVFGILIYRLIPMAKEEVLNSNVEQVSLNEIFNTKGHFYVYFSREDCRYCKNIEKDINDLSSNLTVYMVDPELCENIIGYDWDEHELKYDVEIGEMLSNGDIKYYNDLTEKDIKEQYPAIDYKIVLANERYVELHKGKEAGKIYAVYTHPVLEKSDFQIDNFCVPAIPILVEFDSNNVIKYYFDDKEIIEYLGSDTEPLDKYWNLE